MGGELWQLNLMTPGTRCGIELESKRPEGKAEILPNESYNGQLIVTNGTVQLRDGTRQLSVSANQFLPIDAKHRGKLVPDKLIDAGDPLSVIPDWLDPDIQPVTRSLRLYASQFEKEFDTEKTVTYSIQPLIKNEKAKLSELAVKTLALTQNVTAMCEALADRSSFDEGRKAASIGLRRWLMLDTDNDAQLKQALERQFDPTDTLILQRLLWGFSKKDAQNDIISRELVRWLDHPSSHRS